MSWFLENDISVNKIMNASQGELARIIHTIRLKRANVGAPSDRSIGRIDKDFVKHLKKYTLLSFFHELAQARHAYYSRDFSAYEETRNWPEIAEQSTEDPEQIEIPDINSLFEEVFNAE